MLDEAQRIKNWQTKTARRVKSLRSPYAFVLTGTPLENRIDELYSIIQYLDPEVLGPLFRFNRDFYELDERGRPVDYKNLADLRERVAPLMLRRRKADVETELPGRTVKNYFVAMAEEQKLRYEDYRLPAAQLIAKAQRRPLRQQEFDRLQQLLACMRMVCDTPAILDPSCRVSPKLEELERILGDLLAEPDRKVIVFSEWERMLKMVRELAGEMGVEAAWHTGSLPQERRRAEINRFKRDPACRLFLSTDSGSVGLNLQVASAVVNVDLPWNPSQARTAHRQSLAQEPDPFGHRRQSRDRRQHRAHHSSSARPETGARRWRARRRGRSRRSENAVGPRRLHRAYAGDDGHAATRGAPRVISAEEEFVADLVERLGEKALLVEERRGEDGRTRLLVVLDTDAETSAAEAARAAANGAVRGRIRGPWHVADHAASGRRRAVAVHRTRRGSCIDRSRCLPSPASAKLPTGEGLQPSRRPTAPCGWRGRWPTAASRRRRRRCSQSRCAPWRAALIAARGETSTGAPCASGRRHPPPRRLRRTAGGSSDPSRCDASRSSSAATMDDVAPLLSSTTRILTAIGRNEPSLTVRSASSA